MIDLLQLAGQLGGVGGVLAIVIFFMYRMDRRSTEKMWRESKKFTEDRLTEIIEKDQETREANTRIMAEVFALLKNINGKRKR